MSEEEDGAEGDLAVQVRPRTKRPRRYKVILHNDDYTPMEFVVSILIEYFNKSPTEATHIMLNVHVKGIGICGIYTYDIAETKVKAVSDAARTKGYPLRISIEPES